jgi:hypothetical protein
MQVDKMGRTCRLIAFYLSVHWRFATKVGHPRTNTVLYVMLINL